MTASDADGQVAALRTPALGGPSKPPRIIAPPPNLEPGETNQVIPGQRRLRSLGPSSDRELLLLTAHQPLAGEDSSNSSERYGLRLVEERPPAWMRKQQTVRVTPLLPVPSPSVPDRLIALGFAAFLLTYVAGIGLGLCWALRWLVGV